MAVPEKALFIPASLWWHKNAAEKAGAKGHRKGPRNGPHASRPGTTRIPLAHSADAAYFFATAASFTYGVQ